MAQKYIVQDNLITKIVYVGGCQTAKGGHQKVQEQADALQNQSWLDDGNACEQIANGTRIHGKYHEKNYRAREKKRKQIIEELVFNNFEPCNSGMLTLTFSKHTQPCVKNEAVQMEDMSIEQELFAMLNNLETKSAEPIMDEVKIYDPAQEKYKDLAYCNKQFKQFVQRMRYRFPLFRYVAVTAQQENGNWHYHMICNLNYIPFDELRAMWRNGAVYFKPFKQTGMAGFWKAVRYLQKNMRQAELKGEKGYLCSKGLNRNLVYRSWVDSEAQQVNEIEKSLAGIQPSYSYESRHDYYGLEENRVFERELTATTKYFKFFQSNAEHFTKLPNAYRPKKTGL